MKLFLSKLVERLSKLAPLLIGAFWVVGIYSVVVDPNWGSLLSLVFFIYLAPVLMYRLIAIFIPVQRGMQYLSDSKAASGWVIAHRFQLIYYNFEFVESALKLIPGVYSFWLRLWGSKIGKRVYWTPHTRVGDRTMLDFGDNVFIGNATYISPHVVKAKGESFVLLIEPVKLNSNTFVGTHCVLGPGATLEKGQVLPPFTALIGKKARKIDFSEVQL